MNREQRRAEEKQVSKDGRQVLDIAIDRPILPDGVQFRIPAKTEIGGKEVTLSYATVVVPFIYEEPLTKKPPHLYEQDTPGFMVKFSKDTERKVVGFDPTECLIMDITTMPDYRRKGIGRVLIEHMKTFYDRMITGARTEEGKSLMLRCGFKITEQGQLVWAKDEDELKEKDE